MTTPQQVKTAQQHFLAQNPDFRSATDQEIVDIIMSHLAEHMIPIDTTIKALADIVTRNLRIIRATSRVYKGKFDIFITSDQINHLFVRVTGKSFAEHRDQHIAAPVTAPLPSKRNGKTSTMMLDVSGLSPQLTQLLEMFCQNLGVTWIAE